MEAGMELFFHLDSWSPGKDEGKLQILAENYPRGYRELRGSFFNMHGPSDTMSWFTEHGVALKVEDDGRVFPVSNSSSTIMDCLLSEAKHRGVSLQTGKVVTSASSDSGGRIILKVEKKIANLVEHVPADYLLIPSGSSQQGYGLARQVGSMLITHWGLSGPVILRLSVWGARDLFASGYKGILTVDFTPDLNIEDVKKILARCKDKYAKQKLLISYPSEFGIMKRFWKYILDREGLNGDSLWASISNSSIPAVANLVKQCAFTVTGKVIYHFKRIRFLCKSLNSLEIEYAVGPI